jgi:hypothetical protein
VVFFIASLLLLLRGVSRGFAGGDLDFHPDIDHQTALRLRLVIREALER